MPILLELFSYICSGNSSKQQIKSIMTIEIIDSRFVQYIISACDVLKCTPQVLLEDALKLHEASFKVLSQSLLVSCEIRNVERNLNSVEDGN